MTTRGESDPVGPFTTDLPDVENIEVKEDDGDIITRWTEVLNHGEYRVQIRELNETSWDEDTAGFEETTVSDGNCDATIEDVDTSRSYEVRARTETDDETGDWAPVETVVLSDVVLASDPVAFSTDLPDVEGFVLDGSEPQELDVEEIEPELNHGEYDLEWRRSEDDDWEDSATIAYDEEYTIEDVLDGEEYDVRVRSVTEDATGEWHEATELTKLFPAEDVEIVDVDETLLSLEWSDESEFDGSYQLWIARTDYSYGDDPGRLEKTVDDDAEEAVIDGLQPGREYDVTVRAQTQYVRADSDPATGETEGVGLETRSVPSDGPYVEIDHPARSSPLTPEIETIQRQPTVNGHPRVSMTIPADDRWLTDDRLDDAETRVWIDGERQPADRLEHRTYSPASVDLQARGATQLDRRVVESIDIEEALEVAVYLIEEYTDYDVEIDDIENIVREDVLLQLAETLAELQQAFEEIPGDLPLEWDGDNDRLVPLQTAWLFEAEDGTGTQEVSDDDYSGGEGAAFLSESDSSGGHTFETEYTIPAGEGVFVARGEVPGSTMDLEITIDGDTVTQSFSPGGGLGWNDATIDFDLEPGSHTLDIDGYDAIDGSEVVLDVAGVVDDRYDYTWDNEVHEDGGYLDGPEPIPDVVRLLLDEIATPLSIVAAYLDVSTDDGEGIELSIGEDGTDDWDTVEDTLSHDLEYDELSATLLARVGLGRKEDLEPRDETPRLGYEARALESIEVRADLDETPVLVNYAPDKRLMDALREIMDIADAVFAALPGEDGTEIHVSRIDGRPSDVDPDLIDYSIKRNTEDTVDRAIVYAGAESIRRLPFQADVDEWADLPLGDGRIVRGSESVYDATDDEESLERGEDYEIVPNNPDGPPQIKLLTELDEPRIDCDFKPRGEHEAVDLPDGPSVIIEDAPNLASQQMADIAAFQAVEGSYTDAIIDASITVPVDQIGWNVLDALNVAALPGDQPYQTKDGDSDPASGDYRLGAGRTGQDEIQQLNDETGRLSEKV